MKTSRDVREERKHHPGWSVQFEDGSWLGGAHGWYRSDDAFYADIYDTEEEAHNNLKYIQKDKSEGEYFALPAKVVPAWEPLCESLRVSIYSLQEANLITPSAIFDMVMSLEDVLHTLKGPSEKE